MLCLIFPIFLVFTLLCMHLIKYRYYLDICKLKELVCTKNMNMSFKKVVFALMPFELRVHFTSCCSFVNLCSYFWYSHELNFCTCKQDEYESTFMMLLFHADYEGNLLPDSLSKSNHLYPRYHDWSNLAIQEK